MIEPGGIVPSGADAERVTRCARLLVAVLLRHDARVQRAFEDWWARAGRYEDAGQFTESAAFGFLFESSVQLNALVRALRLERYQSWLPKSLMFEFSRAAGVPVEDYILPPIDRRAWAKFGRVPKNGPKQRDPLARDVEWYYRATVKNPRETVYAIGKEYAAQERIARRPSRGFQHSTVQNAIARVEAYLGAIDRPLPPPDFI